jgi:hypothetical protein
MTRSATILVAAGLGFGGCAAGAHATTAQTQDISVTPPQTRPGSQITLSVPNCSVGDTRHWASSPAFVGDVTLYGKAYDGVSPARLKPRLAAGKYSITAYCGTNDVARGYVTVLSTDAAQAKPPLVRPKTIKTSPASSDTKARNKTPPLAFVIGLAVLIGVAYWTSRRLRR